MSLLAPGRNIVLVGMMGSGKTTVGRRLAERLRRPFVDTDEWIEHDSGMTVAAIFSERGERGFRAHEAEVVRHVAALRGQVLAVGGGAVLDDFNVTALQATGDLVYLHAPPEELARRLADDDGARPLLTGADDPVARVGELLAARRHRYRQAAARELDTTGRSPENVVEEVLRWAQRQPGLLAREERDA